LQRWVYDAKDGINVNKKLNFPWTSASIIPRIVRKQTYAQGVGRHTEEEVHQVMHEDLKALSMFIGMIYYTLICTHLYMYIYFFSYSMYTS
jgi:hypothetical protein